MTYPPTGDPGQNRGSNFDPEPTGWAPRPTGGNSFGGNPGGAGAPGGSPFAGSWGAGPTDSAGPSDRFAGSPGGYVPDPNDVPPPPRRRGNGLLIGGAIAAVVVLGAGATGAFLFLGDDTSSDAAPPAYVNALPRVPLSSERINAVLAKEPTNGIVIPDAASAEFASSKEVLLVRREDESSQIYKLDEQVTEVGGEFTVIATHCDPVAFHGDAVCLDAEKVKFFSLTENPGPDTVSVPGVKDILVTPDAVYAGGRNADGAVFISKIVSKDQAADEPIEGTTSCPQEPTFDRNSTKFVSFGGFAIVPQTGIQVGNKDSRVIAVGDVALLQACNRADAPVEVFKSDGSHLATHEFAPTQQTSAQGHAANRPNESQSRSSETVPPANPPATTPEVITDLAVAAAGNYYAIGDQVFDAATGKKTSTIQDRKSVSLIVGSTAIVVDGTDLKLYKTSDGALIETNTPIAAPANRSTVYYDGNTLLILSKETLRAINPVDGSEAWTLPDVSNVTPAAAGLIATTEGTTKYFAAS